jgi:hypothetical protein
MRKDLPPQFDNNKSNNESKIGKITNLVLKINNSERLFKYCTDRFGKDFLDKLLNPDTSENLIDPLEDYIFELENSPSKIKYRESNKIMDYNNQNYNDDRSGLNENYQNEYQEEIENQPYIPNLNTDVIS